MRVAGCSAGFTARASLMLRADAGSTHAARQTASGFASRHNSRYWKQSPYLGFGPGAHGDFAGQRYEIPRDLSAWLRGEAQPEREDEHEIDRTAEYIMLSLRTSAGFDAEFYTKQFSADPAPVERALSRLPKQYVHHTGSRWSLTEDGFLISNAVIVSVLEEI